MKTQTLPKSSILRIDTMNTLTDWIKQHAVGAALPSLAFRRAIPSSWHR